MQNYKQSISFASMVTLETLVIYTGDHFSAHTCSDLSLEKNCLLPLEVILSLPKKCLNTQSNLKIFSPLLFFLSVTKDAQLCLCGINSHSTPGPASVYIHLSMHDLLSCRRKASAVSEVSGMDPDPLYALKSPDHHDGTNIVCPYIPQQMQNYPKQQVFF